MNQEQVNAIMEPLRRAYRVGLLERIAELQQLVARCPAEPELVPALVEVAHKVRGSAGTYGFWDAGNCAGAIEDALDHENPPWPAMLALAMGCTAEAVEPWDAASDDGRAKLAVVGQPGPGGAIVAVFAQRQGIAVTHVASAEQARELAAREPVCGVILGHPDGHDAVLDGDVPVASLALLEQPEELVAWLRGVATSVR